MARVTAILILILSLQFALTASVGAQELDVRIGETGAVTLVLEMDPPDVGHPSPCPISWVRAFVLPFSHSSVQSEPLLDTSRLA